MILYFSKQTNGFYNSDIFTPEMLPNDAVVISKETYDSLLRGQEQGKRIIGDENGLPCLRDHDPPSEQDIRNTRDQLLKETDWTQLPDIPETTRSKWAEYRQLLRDIPSQTGFPLEIVWPVKPN